MKTSTRLLLLLAVVKFCLPFFLQHSFYQPHRDEFLYLAEGKHLAWGYMEVPPMLSVFSWFTHLLGGGFFWIKFWPSLFGGITLFITGKIAEELGGKLFAVFISALGIIAGSYLRVHFLFQANFLDIFSWTICAYFLVRYINSGAIRYIYLLGAALGFGWLSKYSIVFFGAGIFVGLLATQNRRIFYHKHIYIAGFIALLIALPNLLWQYYHHWPVLAHMKELRETQLQFISPSEFLIEQLKMNFSYTFIWIGGLIWLLFFNASKPYRLLAWIYITVIIALIATSGKDYYALGAYPMLFAAGGVWLENITAVKFKWLRYVTLAFITIMFIIIVPLLLPLWKPDELAAYYQKSAVANYGKFKWEDQEEHPLPQDFADMMGWREITVQTAGVYNKLTSEEKKETIIYCRGYYSAGALDYYGQVMGLPEVYSDDASFLFWMPEKYAIKNLILVAHNIPGKDDIVFQQFEKMTIEDSLHYPLARENGMRIFLFRNGHAVVNSLIEKSISEQKAKFTRH